MYSDGSLRPTMNMPTMMNFFQPPPTPVQIVYAAPQPPQPQMMIVAAAPPPPPPVSSSASAGISRGAAPNNHDAASSSSSSSQRNGDGLVVGKSYRGIVKRYNPTRGFGFIRSDCGVDIFVHQSCIRMDGFRAVNVGAPVKFTVGILMDTVQAVDVVQETPYVPHAGGNHVAGQGAGCVGGNGSQTGGGSSVSSSSLGSTSLTPGQRNIVNGSSQQQSSLLPVPAAALMPLCAPAADFGEGSGAALVMVLTDGSDSDSNHSQDHPAACEASTKQPAGEPAGESTNHSTSQHGVSMSTNGGVSMSTNGGVSAGNSHVSSSTATTANSTTAGWTHQMPGAAEVEELLMLVNRR